MAAISKVSSFAEMFRPPVDRAMRVLDRSFFQKKVPLAAARIFENDQITKCRSELGRDVLCVDRLSSVRPDPEETDASRKKRTLLLTPSIRPDDPTTWGSKLQKLIGEQRVAVAPYELALTYEYWTYHDIMTAILPEDEQGELPAGFSIVGHVAHLNIRDQFLQYRHLIASVLMDKNPGIRTVINKIDEVGTQNEYRTFQYELLAGEPSLEVSVKHLDCSFHFDYSKVYWNTRLNTEHERLVKLFKPGQAVCDVMAGIGPFAVPAGKKSVFVWANDLNPDSHASLVDAISRNKVSDFVKPFNEDGRAFIKSSAQSLLQERKKVDVSPKRKKGSRSAAPLSGGGLPMEIFLEQPKTFDHYVMNLPATAITFLDAFIGVYRGHEALFSPHTRTKLPMIHVHCFSTKSDDNVDEEIKICEEISLCMDYKVNPKDPEVEIWDVRDVAPKKRMFCATFRLPAEVAFRS